jgi:glycosyltransferase involved in cell wall biosynthesis
VRSRGHDIKAILAGDGHLRSGLLNLARELGVENQVVFAGNVDQDWLSKVIPLATAVISPHTGRALSEAALGGVPIVAYDVDWQGELIQTGITGELVRHLNLAGMVDSLERIIKYSEYAQTMGDSVRKRIIEMMDPETLNQHERDQYRAVMERFKKQRSHDSENSLTVP